MPDINSDIQYLKGVGPAYAKKFAKLGIYTIRDLLLHYPRRYIDYSQPYTVVSRPMRRKSWNLEPNIISRAALAA